MPELPEEVHPEHWEVKPLKDLFSFAKGKNASLYTKEYIADHLGVHPVYSGQTENDGVMSEIDSYDYELPATIIVTTVGASAMTTKTVEGRFSLSQNCALLIPRSSSASIDSFDGFLNHVFRYEKGSTSLIMQPSLRFEDLYRYRVVVPPAQEQASIAKHPESACVKWDEILKMQSSSISLLLEYRSALISAVVSGQMTKLQGDR